MRRIRTIMPLLPVVAILFCWSLSNFADAFTTGTGTTGRSSTRAALEMSSDLESIFEKIQSIPNPFARSDVKAFDSPESASLDPFEPTPEGLIARAKSVLGADLGLKDAALLDESFIWIGPTLEKPLGKIDYLAAGRFFNLRGAFPDLDFRAHDFRIDVNDPFTVRMTARTIGTMRGQLRLRNEVLDRNGIPLRSPPEAISLTFDGTTGKVLKLCSGFTMDRLVGNTAGLCGVMGAAVVAGAPPSDWEVYPIPAVIARFFGRPVKQLAEPSTFIAPFPETVMIQLAKGILSASLASDDPTLLRDDFTYCTPYVGPTTKDTFLESYAKEEFGGYEPQFSHFRVDQFDPYRVWVDVKQIGLGFEGPPQAFSFAFDDEGFCTRLTAGAVMDSSIGKTVQRLV
jgi:hypothetical protein